MFIYLIHYDEYTVNHSVRALH